MLESEESAPVFFIAKLIPMKRELKEIFIPILGATIHKIAKLIPMKRELKVIHKVIYLACKSLDRKADPDEKGTESPSSNLLRRYALIQIAKLIPMKRELKVFLQAQEVRDRGLDRKADPDEKGTERVHIVWRGIEDFWDRKADPDEKGTER